jgi:hypothetical protein
MKPNDPTRIAPGAAYAADQAERVCDLPQSYGWAPARRCPRPPVTGAPPPQATKEER